ncbi:hypothetical protein [Natrialba sp. INN-245]|nr:hypothetical protein [Natrialba sp. INN-245]
MDEATQEDIEKAIQNLESGDNDTDEESDDIIVADDHEQASGRDR